MSARLELLPSLLWLVGVFFLGVAHANAIIYGALYGAILLGAWVYRDRLGSIPWSRFKGVGIFFLIYLALAILSLFYSLDVKKSVSEIRGEIVQNFLLFIASVALILLVDRRYLAKLALALGVIFALHMLYGVGVWLAEGGYPYRVAGLLATSKAGLGIEKFGIWVLYALALGVALLLQGGTRGVRIVGAILLGLALVAVMANNTRATVLGALVMFGALAWLFHSRRERFLALGGGLLLLGAVLVGLYYQGERLGQRYDLRLQSEKVARLWHLPPASMGALESEGMDHSIASRLAMWRSIVLSLQREPWIPRGYGRELYKETITQEWGGSENLPYALYRSPHNAFLSMAHQLGIVGLAWMVAWLGYLGVQALRLSHSATPYRWFGAFGFLGLIGFSVSIGFGDFFADSEARLFYIISGAGLALRIRGDYD